MNKEKLDDFIGEVLYYLGYYYVQEKYYDFKHFIKNVIRYRKELTHDVSTWQCEGMLVFNKKYLQGILEDLEGQDFRSDTAQNRKNIKRCIFLIDELIYNLKSRNSPKIYIPPIDSQLIDATTETQSNNLEIEPPLSVEEQDYEDKKKELFTLLMNYDKWWM